MRLCRAKLLIYTGAQSSQKSQQKEKNKNNTNLTHNENILNRHHEHEK
uniref:Uncharacterized protein n=1 Tax=Glossina brevipalpis TaxID=37001 RepID=A0A1A9WZ00_9MUSC